jgi:hypothetical protein
MSNQFLEVELIESSQVLKNESKIAYDSCVGDQDIVGHEHTDLKHYEV